MSNATMPLISAASRPARKRSAPAIIDRDRALFLPERVILARHQANVITSRARGDGAPLDVNLRQYFTRRAIARVLTQPAVVQQPTYSRIYPNRQQHGLPYLGWDILREYAEEMPVVSRGTRAISVGGDNMTTTGVEPQPIELSSFMGAKEINDFRALRSTATRQTVMDGKIRRLRNNTTLTIEGLCQQSLSCAISWPMKLDDGSYDSYVVDFNVGPATDAKSRMIENEAPAVDLTDGANLTRADVVRYMIKVAKRFQARGLAPPAEYLIGQNFFDALLELGDENKADAAIRVSVNPVITGDSVLEPTISVGGYMFRLWGYTHTNPQTKAVVSAIGDDEMWGRSASTNFGFYFCSIDDLEANFAATPLFITTESSKNPSGETIISRSKPIPVPVSFAVIKRDVSSTTP